MESPTKIVIADKNQQNQLSFSADLDLQFQCKFENVFTETDLFSTLKNGTVDILILDFEFCSDNEGISFIESLKKINPDTYILPILPTGSPHIIKQVLSLNLFYFIHKPIDPVETSIAIKRAYENLPQKTKSPSDAVKSQSPYHGMIGCSECMQHLFNLITKVAEDDFSTVLIRGESGTGKEMVAKAIHKQSIRRDKNFVPVNCAAIPDDLLESELFGYTKGAFTGATNNKPGRIQYADQGTLFLDEIGDMKASLQAKLLRVIQEKEFEPVGAFKSIPVNTRILAATHCDLEQLVSEGKFREDLYYRLSVIPLNIPPLRERMEDLPLLIDAFLTKYAKDRGRDGFAFTDEARAALEHYNWKGNVRELENLVQHMVILFSGKQISFKDLPEKFQNSEIPKGYTTTTPVSEPSAVGENFAEIDEQSSPAPSLDEISWQSGPIDFNELINDFETQLIVQALKITEGNKKEAAKLLNLKRTTLLEKIKKKSIEGLWNK